MDIKEYKKIIIPKINVGDLSKNVKKVIKQEKNKEQNFREGINRRKLYNIISDVNTNKNKYNFRDSIVNNLEMLNYNLLRLLGQPQPIQQPIDDDDGFPPPIGNIPPPPPPPPPIGNIPPPPPPPPFDFPPPPPPNLFDQDDPQEENPTLPLPLPAYPTLTLPPSEPLSQIVKSARENLLDEIVNPSKKLKPVTEKPVTEKPIKTNNIGEIMRNTINKLMEERRLNINTESEEEEEEEEEEWD